MIKIATLLALLGVSMTQSVTPRFWSRGANSGSGVFNYPDSGYKNLFNSMGLNLNHFAQADAGWGTLYGGADSNKADTRTESYGVQVWSFGKHNAVANYHNWYTMSVESFIEPVYAAPYVQHVMWTRFESTPGFTLTVAGTREVAAFDWALDMAENMGTVQDSLFDGLDIPERAADFNFDGTFVHEWRDGRYSGNLLKTLKLDDNFSKILGMHQYYSKAIVE